MIDMFDTIMNLVKEWNVTGICLRLALATFVGGDYRVRPGVQK